ncbi:MAG: hypothetical protein V7L29_04855 [Nostoc sp.]
MLDAITTVWLYFLQAQLFATEERHFARQATIPSGKPLCVYKMAQEQGI